MLKLFKFLLVLIFIASFISCNKQNIVAINVPMYKQTFSVVPFDDNNMTVKSFISLNGFVAAAGDILDAFNQNGITATQSTTDFGLAGSTLTTPGSSYGYNALSYQYSSYGVSNWGTRRGGLFSVSSLKTSDFDTIVHIESILKQAKSCSDEYVDLGNIPVFLFYADRGYGIGIVKSIDSWGNTTVELKYALTNP